MLKFIKRTYILTRLRLHYYKIFLHNLLFAEKKPDYKNIPIIVNNFNRLTFLKDLLADLEKRGYTNIYIIDNHSTYPPLLEYYKSCPYTIFRLKDNLGFQALDKSGISKMFRDRYFVYTDSDIALQPECPDNFLEYFLKLLQHTSPYVAKVGCALRIDNLPDYYANKQKVIEWETQFWEKPIQQNVYDALIDTTFALYKPNMRVGYFDTLIKAKRVAGPYAGIHQPWYLDSKHLGEEDVYYICNSSQSTSWTSSDFPNLKDA